MFSPLLPSGLIALFSPFKISFNLNCASTSLFLSRFSVSVYASTSAHAYVSTFLRLFVSTSLRPLSVPPNLRSSMLVSISFSPLKRLYCRHQDCATFLIFPASCSSCLSLFTSTIMRRCFYVGNFSSPVFGAAKALLKGLQLQLTQGEVI